MDGGGFTDGGGEIAIGLKLENPADAADVFRREGARQPGAAMCGQAWKGERRFLVMVTVRARILIRRSGFHCLGTQRRERRPCQKCRACQKGRHGMMGGIGCPSHSGGDVGAMQTESNSQLLAWW
ncbi:hypothetical protein JCM25156A_11170 [Komagataeibacter kakiaceti JCM 25156]